ncbi:MAG: flagellar biosynthesis regulator FlaF [Pseudomonadota bacterium]
MAVKTANPREVEAQLLLKAAARLEASRTANADVQTARDAITYNRKLWTVFASSIARPENPLPQEIKQNIGSLAVFILGHSMEAFSRPEPEKLEPLVAINRQIAAGLIGNAA